MHHAQFLIELDSFAIIFIFISNLYEISYTSVALPNRIAMIVDEREKYTGTYTRETKTS